MLSIIITYTNVIIILYCLNITLLCVLCRACFKNPFLQTPVSPTSMAPDSANPQCCKEKANPKSENPNVALLDLKESRHYDGLFQTQAKLRRGSNTLSPQTTLEALFYSKEHTPTQLSLAVPKRRLPSPGSVKKGQKIILSTTLLPAD